MDSFIPSTIRRARNQRRLTLASVAGSTGMSPQHLSEIESGKCDPRLSSIERFAGAMKLSVMLVPDCLASEVRRYVASNGRVFTINRTAKDGSDDQA